MSKEYLAKKDGYLCVVSEDTFSDEPTLYRNYFPCFRIGEREFKENYSGKCQIYASSFPGRYVIFFDGGIRQEICLCELGQTKSICNEQEPVPCPKVRKGIKTRWHLGCWEKLLQTNGWVRA